MTQPTNAQKWRTDATGNNQGNNRQAAIDDLTDSSGGTPAATVVAVSGSGDDANINNNFATLNAEIDKLKANFRLFGHIAD